MVPEMEKTFVTNCFKKCLQYVQSIVFRILKNISAQNVFSPLPHLETSISKYSFFTISHSTKLSSPLGKTKSSYEKTTSGREKKKNLLD